MRVLLKILFISFLFQSCFNQSKKVQVPESDTAYAIRLTIDSFYEVAYKQLFDPDKYRKDILLAPNEHWMRHYFDDNPFGDSIIFLKDSLFSKYLPNKGYKLKLLDKDEICTQVYNSRKKGKFFPSIIETRYYLSRDSITYIAQLKNVSTFSTKDSSGNYVRSIEGQYYSGTDTCKFDSWETEFDLYFEKTKHGLRVKSKRLLTRPRL